MKISREADFDRQNVFGKGDPNAAYAQYFVGNSFLNPLTQPGQATTTQENRLERGAQLQAEIFGAQLLEAWKNGPVNRWLAANCFGDFYTRTGLDLRQRELITLCFLAAQGGCEPQLTAHIKGNLALGASPEQLSAVLYACLPYIGYPRMLNALSCLRQAAGDAE